MKTLRKKLGLTQAELASELGITTSTISKWERDEERAPKWIESYLQMKLERVKPLSILASINMSIKDSLHQKILERLNGKVDPFDFEQCVVDLLVEDGFSVVLVGGSGDGGFDGEVEDPAAEPSPLIVTTATDILQNFRRNLKKAKSGTDSRRVYLATTKSVRSKTRLEIRKFAKSLGFTVGQIFDQNWVARQLHRNLTWCKKLLNISGNPPALCSVPISTRPVYSNVLIGRTTELNQLQESHGDCLLCGPPGSGKTFLLSKLVQENRALFLCDDDRERVSDEIRELEPQIIIVDDAHTQLERLKNLVHLRETISAEFRIVAASWSFQKDLLEVQNILRIDTLRTVTLEPLCDRKILEIIEDQGNFTERLQNVLIKQSHGMPGLVVTLSQLCLRNLSSLRAVVSGEALLNDLMQSLAKGLDKDMKRTLAAFAVGGSSGMSVKIVAKHLKKSEIKLSEQLRDLSFAGILYITYDEHIVIQPYPLAFRLVYEVYLSDPLLFELYAKLIEKSPSKREVAKVLMHMLAFGVDVDQKTYNYIRTILNQYKEHLTNSELVFLASIGMKEANFVIEEFPDRLLSTARGFLRVDPEKFLPVVFDQVAQSANSFEGHFSQFQDLLKGWLTEVTPNHPAAMRRRIRLITSSIDWYEQQTSSSKEIARVTNYSLTRVFEGLWRGATPSPIEMELKCYFWVPDLKQTKTLHHQWPKIVDYLCDTANQAEYWHDTIDLIRQWVFVIGRVKPDEQTIVARKKFATTLRNNLAERFKNQPSLLTEITRFDKDIPNCSKVNIEPEFQILFSTPRGAEIEKSFKKISPILEKYLKLGIKHTVKTISSYEREARKANRFYLPVLVRLCERAAVEVDDPYDWLEAFLKAKCAGHLIKPFIRESYNVSSRKTVDLVAQHNKDGSYLRELFEISVRSIDYFRLHEPVLLKFITDDLEVLYFMRLASDMHSEVLLELLTSADSNISFNVALAYYNEKNSPPPALQKEWEQAILNHEPRGWINSTELHSLERTLSSYPDLAEKWVLNFFHNVSLNRAYQHTGVPLTVIQSLSEKARLELLSKMSFEFCSSDEINVFVQQDPKTYRLLLQSRTLCPEQLLLAPLTVQDKDRWRNLLLVALKHGIDEQKIAERVAHKCVYSGEFETKEQFQKKCAFYDQFDKDTNSNVVKTVRVIQRNLNDLLTETEHMREPQPFNEHQTTACT